jgi:hypothetical protein
LFLPKYIPTKLFLDFCPEIFCSFLGVCWKLFGLYWNLIGNIMNKEAHRKPKKSFQEALRELQKISGQKSRNNFVGILGETKFSYGHYKIN